MSCKRYIRPALLCAWCIAACSFASIARADAETQSTAAPERLPDGVQVLRLDVVPASIELVHRYDARQILVFGELTNGQRADVTRMVTVEQEPELLAVSAGLSVRPKTDGQGQLRISLGGLLVAVPVAVSGTEAPYDVDFVGDVMPVLSKAGCNAGTCHGAKDGKNGFKLSLRGYDPAFDHRALTDDLAARRFNRAEPDESLMLLKASGAVPHVGGVRTRPGEPYYEILRAWIAGGGTIDLEAPRVTQIELYPQNPVIAMPYMTQQMVVMATFADGRKRDVTSEAFIESGQIEILDADEQGRVTALRRGEAAVLARFEGAYASTTVTVMGDRSGFAWEEVPEFNYIDTLVYDKLKRVRVLPSPLADDATFLRRVYLDITGLPPDPEVVRAFLADERETQVKRDEVVDRLVGSPEYVEHWTNKWSDLFTVNSKFLTEKGAWALRNWVRQAVAENMPYDQMAYQILTASGSTFVNPPAAYMRTLREPDMAMENSTQLFLGVRFNCNKCHDHPFERWTQNQYYDLAAFFAQIGRKRGANPGEEVIYDTPGRGEVKHPTSGQTVPPSFPYEHSDLAAEDANRRVQFAHWVVSPENQYFATSFVNRVFSYLMGVGLIEPVDDIRAGNPPTNPQLLKRLTDDFVSHGFDVEHLIRTICKSRAYQHAVETNEWNEDDTINYAHATARRLQAETLYDAIQQAMGIRADLPGVPAGYRAAQLADASTKLPGGFLDLFGRPPRESACECERSGGVVLGQALTLVNGEVIADAIANKGNRLTRLILQYQDDAQVVDELFLAVLCRPPTEAERETGLTAIREAGNRLEGAQDLAWALLNSPAFLFNH